MQTIRFGNTDLEVSPLAVGTGTHGWAGSSAQTRKGTEWLSGLLVEAFGKGVNFWDLADQYGSHSFAREAIRRLKTEGVPRERLVIGTKTTTTGHRGTAKDVDRFLKEIGIEYLDHVLLHAVSSFSWPKRRAGAMRALEAAREAGKVRYLGVSCHGFGALEKAAEESWVQVILARLNYAGQNMDAGPERVLPVLQRAKENGKTVYGMKILGCGGLSSDPEKAVGWAFSKGVLDAATIGIESEKELDQLISIFERVNIPQTAG